MSINISLIAKDRASITLIAQKEETFLDEQFHIVGLRFTPDKPLSNAMVDILQSTNVTVQIKLINRDGTPYDLTGYMTATLGIFQRTPLAQTISLTAGSPAGLLTDGILNFVLSASDTNFVGFAEGQVQLTTGTGTMGFESFQVVYRKNLFI